jgi:outer membrane lipoprotein-sorting protein
LIHVKLKEKKMKALVLLIGILLPSFALAQSAEEIISIVDKNRVYITQKFAMKMTISRGKSKLIKTFEGFSKRDGLKSFMWFTNPEDRGVKYLKSGKELWIYFPDADDVMKISGHMLKQGMMGSDISYEDMLETEEARKKYSSKLLKEETFDGRACFVVELNAIVPDASYEKQVMYVDKQNYVPLKMEMYAKGGRLIKTFSQSDIINIGGRNLPKKAEIQDVRKKNTKTTVEFLNMTFDEPVSDDLFNKRYLKK